MATPRGSTGYTQGARLDCSKELRCVYGNAAWRAWVPPEKFPVEGQSLLEILEGLAPSPLLAILRQVCATGTATHLRDFEYVGLVGAPVTLPGDVTLWDWEVYPLTDIGGVHSHLLVVGMNATERALQGPGVSPEARKRAAEMRERASGILPHARLICPLLQILHGGGVGDCPVCFPGDQRTVQCEVRSKGRTLPLQESDGEQVVILTLADVGGVDRSLVGDIQCATLEAEQEEGATEAITLLRPAGHEQLRGCRKGLREDRRFDLFRTGLHRWQESSGILERCRCCRELVPDSAMLLRPTDRAPGVRVGEIA